MYTFMHIYIHNTYTPTKYLPTYIHVHTTYIHTYVHIYVHTYIRTYIHTYIQTYIHTYTHTYSVLVKACYKTKIIRIQRLINIRIAKAYHTESNEALCVITGLIPINIKIEEAAKYYEYIKGNGNLFDQEMEVKHWTHPGNCQNY